MNPTHAKIVEAIESFDGGATIKVFTPSIEEYTKVYAHYMRRAVIEGPVPLSSLYTAYQKVSRPLWMATLPNGTRVFQTADHFNSPHSLFNIVAVSQTLTHTESPELSQSTFSALMAHYLPRDWLCASEDWYHMIVYPGVKTSHGGLVYNTEEDAERARQDFYELCPQETLTAIIHHIYESCVEATQDPTAIETRVFDVSTNILITLKIDR